MKFYKDFTKCGDEDLLPLYNCHKEFRWAKKLRKAIKQTSRGDLKSSCFEKFRKIHWKTPVKESF